MIARVLKRTLLTWLAAFALLLVAVVVFEPRLAPLVYYTLRHRAAVALKERSLSSPRTAAAIAADLRRFAQEQRWDHPEKKSAAADFYYEKDPRFPDAIKRLEPSWIQISDERIDISCGEITHEGAFSFGLSVWRDPSAAGYGKKRIADGVWYNQQEYEYP